MNTRKDPNKSSKNERNCNSRDAGTQTDEQYFNPNVQLMETTIKNLCERIKSLEEQLKSTEPSLDKARFETVKQNLDFSYESNNDDPDFEMVCVFLIFLSKILISCIT